MVFIVRSCCKGPRDRKWITKYGGMPGNTASNIIRGMYKDETIDIYMRTPANIVLLRATVPQVWADYRDKTVNVFKEKRTV